jgi:cytochrome P450
MGQSNNATGVHGDVTVNPGCPIAKFGQMDSLSKALRSGLLESRAEVFAGAHKFSDGSGDVNVSEFTEGVFGFVDGQVHRNRRKLLNSLVRPKALDAMREEVVLPSALRVLKEKVVRSEDDGVCRADLAEVSELIFLEFATKLIGFVNTDTTEAMERLRTCVSPIFGAIASQFVEDRVTVNRLALEAKERYVDEFYRPARDHYVALLEAAASGRVSYDDVPWNLMRLIVDGADEAYMDDALAIRESILLFNTSVGTSTQALLSTVDDLTGWFREHPEDYERRTDPNFLSQALQESLRLKAPYLSYMTRLAVEDGTIEGQEVRQGQEVHIQIPKANRDPAVFGPDAATFNLRREIPNGYRPYGVAFGSGPHQCYGLRVVMGNDGNNGSHVRLLQALFSAGVEPDPDRKPSLLQMKMEEDAIQDIPSYATYPVIFTEWKDGWHS